MYIYICIYIYIYIYIYFILFYFIKTLKYIVAPLGLMQPCNLQATVSIQFIVC